MILPRPSASFLGLALLCACGSGLEDSGSYQTETHAATAEPATRVVKIPATRSREIRVRAASATSWITPRLSLTPGSNDWQTSSRSSRNLVDVLSYVPDDGFAEAEVVSPRRFDLRIDPGHEINSLLSGLPLFVQLHTATQPNPSTEEMEIRALALWFAPRFSATAGARGIRIDGTMRPVYHRDATDPLRYRAVVVVDQAGCSVDSDFADQTITPIEMRRFAVDVPFSSLTDQVGSSVAFRVTCGAVTRTKTADLFFGIKQVGLTANAAEEQWPAPVCEGELEQCVFDVDVAGGDDFSVCGSYREVSACL